jgi:hypothetical protein
VPPSLTATTYDSPGTSGETGLSVMRRGCAEQSTTVPSTVAHVRTTGTAAPAAVLSTGLPVAPASWSSDRTVTAPVSVVGAVTVSTGASESTFHAAELRLTFPALSEADAMTECPPWASPVSDNVTPVEHRVAVPSTVQFSWSPAEPAVTRTSADVVATQPVGAVIDGAVGAVRSTSQA